MITVDHPYPSLWDRHIVLSDGRQVFTRPIRSDDESLVLQLLQNVSAEDLRFRFFDSIKEFTHPFLARLTQLDCMMAFIALDETSGETLGVVRVYIDSIGETGEYAILTRSDLKGHGLGWSLMQIIIEYSKSRNLKRLVGQILQENSVMLRMCQELGFKIKTDADDRGLCDVTLVLDRANVGLSG
jgi:RimJ/RimL family protein N-acetyltransferase